MNIALLTHSVRPRGGVIHTLELAAALLGRGHRVTVIASAEPGESLFRATAFPVELIRLPVLTGDLVAQVRQRIEALVDALPPLLAQGGFDLLHAQDSVSGNALALLRARGARLPRWLRTVHHLDTFAQPTLNRWQERAWRAADGIACVSDTWRTHLHQHFGVQAERMFNGVDLGRYAIAPDPADAQRLQALGLADARGPVCLLVGGVEERKNTVRLLRAFAGLRRGEPSWAQAQLVIAGGASMLDHSAARSAWQQTLAEFGLDEGTGAPVLRTGPLPDEMLPTLMRRADVLAMPSLVEGFGLVALEALACGTPVLVSNRPPFTEHLHDTPAVAWCEPEDTASIAAGLQAAARIPKLSTPPPVCRAHGWEHSAERHEAWYRRTLNTPLAAPAGDKRIPLPT
jgi:glycosyltransferase-like protein